MRAALWRNSPSTLPFLLDHLPQGVLDLRNRRVVRIAVAGDIALAGLRTQPAMDAGLAVGLETRCALLGQHLVDGGLDPLRRQLGNAVVNAGVDDCNILKISHFAFLPKMPET